MAAFGGTDGQPAVLVSEPAGIVVHNDPALLTPELARMIAEGSYERPELDAIFAALTPGRRVLELGGGIGFVSAAVGRRFAPVRHDVVEANPALIAAIRANHALNGLGGIGMHNAVVTSDRTLLRAGRAVLRTGAAFWSSSLHPREGLAGAVEVPVVPLATLMAELRPEVLIADIEGGEPELFTCVRFSTLELVIMEVHGRIFGAAGMRKLFADLARLDLVYDDFRSRGSVVVFRRHDPLRPLTARLYRRLRIGLERLGNRRWRHLRVPGHPWPPAVHLPFIAPDP